MPISIRCAPDGGGFLLAQNVPTERLQLPQLLQLAAAISDQLARLFSPVHALDAVGQSRTGCTDMRWLVTANEVTDPVHFSSLHFRVDTIGGSYSDAPDGRSFLLTQIIVRAVFVIIKKCLNFINVTADVCCVL